ncbi:uncharacterized protein LOC110837070 isoform X2 [Zootermopsis nevadensis]|uniref:uncharacterized protein LOC110837070 isoform X1 n=1 Tax=Zootermopsis nevadensis TaxID=136037 RepID=UPI000B8E5A92|nr:uncharacterized protein LOC110837070 isoform X1 [Zootermopsis nevadensis]XP_021934560.1 uncharacterized protein LOC110837070 isoform X2 [Zootermopsis nevadensis]
MKKVRNMWTDRTTEERSKIPPSDNTDYVRNNVEYGSANVPTDLANWHIPRPSLWCADSNCTCHIARERPEWPGDLQGRGSTSSQASSSSNTSTQSGASGSLLLTAANLAALRYEPTIMKSPDTQSVASSTHFTVVNGITRRKAQPLPTCCCHSHQLTTLVFTMSIIFLAAILMAVIYLEMRWRDINLLR